MKKIELTTVTFEADFGFMIDIVDNATAKYPTWDVWLYRSDYGIKEFMFGLPKELTPTLEDAISITEGNLVDHSYYSNYDDEYAPDANREYEEVDEPDLLSDRELIQKLYDHIGHHMDGVENDIKFDFLTQNEGRDGKQYLWYMDSGMMAIIDEDGNISEDHDKIDELFC